MWNADQFNRVSERIAIGQIFNKPTIVRLEEILQHKTHKQLMLRKFLEAVAMTVRWK